ncbi:MAG: pilin [Patescibacteria group bacterium]
MNLNNKKAKRFKTKYLYSIFPMLLFAVTPLAAHAQTMEKIPGQEEEPSNLIEYLNNLYRFGLSAVAILAVFMIALGAFSYLVTAVGNPSKVQSAKETITNALFGLALAFLAFLILYVINPDLVGGTLQKPGESIKSITKQEEESYWNQGFTPPPTDGRCGSADGGSFTSQPSFDLCAAGARTEVTETSNGWSWSCQGENEGENAECSAERTDNSGSDSEPEPEPEPPLDQEVDPPYTPLQGRHDEFPEKNSGTVKVMPYYLELGSNVIDGSKFSMYVPAGTESLELSMNSSYGDSTLYFSIEDKPVESESKSLGDRTIESLISSDRKTTYTTGGGQVIVLINDFGVNTEDWNRGRWINFKFDGSRPNAYDARYRINTEHPYYYKID